MVFSDNSLDYFSLIQFKIRSAIANSKSSVPYEYENEVFFQAYHCLYESWVSGKSQRQMVTNILKNFL